MSAPAALSALFAQPIAHRGLHACGGPGPVENSRAAARGAIAAGFGIECDVQLSADGEAMVFHDAALDRLTSTCGAIAAAKAPTLQAIALRGTSDTIPTLAAFLELIDGRTPLVVEIKTQPPGDMRLAARTLDIARRYRGVIALESFDPAVVTFLREHEAPCPIGLVGPPEDGSVPSDAALDASDFVSWSIRDIATIAAHRSDLPRSTWTVRTLEQQAHAAACKAQIVFEGFDPVITR